MAKKPTPHRRAKGSGGVEKLKTPEGLRYRARKRQAGQVALGSVRDSWDLAYADLPFLTFDTGALATPTFQDFVEQQLKGPRQRAVMHGTLERDEIVWRTRIHGSELGRSPIDAIDADMCQRFVDAQTHAWRPVKKGEVYELVEGKRLEREGLKRIGAVVSAYLEIARRRPYRLIGHNPMHDVEYPARRREKAGKSLRPQQAADLEERLKDFRTKLRGQGDRFAAMVLVSRDTGMRPGELCALHRSQLVKTIRGYAIAVDAGLVRKNGKMERTATKTGNSRMVPIDADTAQLLLDQPERGQYLFTTASGEPVRPDNYRRTFRQFAVDIGLPQLTPHKLRHTYISLLLQAGKDLKAVQKLVGHATPKMIMEIYAETFDESMVDAPTKLRELLESAKLASESNTVAVG